MILIPEQFVLLVNLKEFERLLDQIPKVEAWFFTGNDIKGTVKAICGESSEKAVVDGVQDDGVIILWPTFLRLVELSSLVTKRRFEEFPSRRFPGGHLYVREDKASNY